MDASIERRYLVRFFSELDNKSVTKLVDKKDLRFFKKFKVDYVLISKITFENYTD